MASLVWLAIVQANVGHLDAAASAGEFASLDNIPPDERRRPASVMAIADGLGLPYETARRHVERLVAKGECRRVKKGVIVPAEAFLDARRKQMVMTNLVNLKRLFRGLASHGVDLS